LFFAFVSVIFGQSACITFWYDRPGSLFGSKKLRNISIVNDQRVMNWYFLSWFSKLATALGAMLFLGNRGYFVFSLYPDFKYIFVLIIAVLFLQTWSTLRLVFRRNSLKWMLASFVILSILAFGLSRINLVDYKTLNNMVLQENVHYKYDLDVPESGSYEVPGRQARYKDIYIVNSKVDQGNSRTLVVINNREVEIEDLAEVLDDPRSKVGAYTLWPTTYRLHIHRYVKMAFVNRIKSKLIRNGIFKIAYAVIPTEHEFDELYYQNFFLPMPVTYLASGLYGSPAIELDMNLFKSIIEIAQNDAGDCFVDDISVRESEFKQTIKSKIQEEQNYIIQFHVNDNVDFGDYLKVLSYTKMAVEELRNAYARKKYLKEFKWLGMKDRRQVRIQYPYYIIDVTSDMVELSGDE